MADEPIESAGADELDDEFVSPFAQVPDANAGPGPLQDGFVTYERMVASAGAASVHHETTHGRGRFVRYTFAFAAGLFLFVLLWALVLSVFG